MIARGRVQNGVVVLQDDAQLPEGTAVVVWPQVPIPAAETAQEGSSTEEHQRRFLEAIDRIASMPPEGSSDPFCGADHDQALYGQP
jgi:hypothetical protein